MESANIHHHQHQQVQDQHAVGSSSLDTTIPSCYAAGATHAHNPNSTILNSSSLNACSNLRDSWQETNSNNILLSSLNNPMMVNAQDLTFHMRNEQRDPNQLEADLLMLRNLSSNSSSYNQMNGFHQLCSEDSSNSSLSSSGSFSQIFPSINVSNFNHQMLSPANSSSSLDMNMQAMDLRNSSRFNDEGFGQLSSDQQCLYSKGGGLTYGFDLHMKQSSSLVKPLFISNNISSFSNGVVDDSKRSNIMLEPKGPHQPATKKSRMDSRASCPPFKVRKEKLGDRIAALQQMVSPFGKTDTASVLMEAIGYIKFLQNQVETLSVPYMKSSANNNKNNSKVIQGPNGNNEESKRDLRSRGLCLVPLSCLSYVTDGGGGVCWPPHNFGGGF
ncbi:basic helix-loop-helix transcription factor [Lithospermum erythrorhizon]|uniref:Basic helix-loop-helix transcription factor n=1 Tax=Lithospermum erythrorhizon TaxID=34254 RepID=A0AAV3P791_LITER